MISSLHSKPAHGCWRDILAQYGETATRESTKGKLIWHIVTTLLGETFSFPSVLRAADPVKRPLAVKAEDLLLCLFFY
jgi:hypothetical protein